MIPARQFAGARISRCLLHPAIHQQREGRVITASMPPYIDYVGSWGPMFWPCDDESYRHFARGGHAHFGAPNDSSPTRRGLSPPYLDEMVRLVNRVTEHLSAIRQHVGPQPDKIVKFECATTDTRDSLS